MMKNNYNVIGVMSGTSLDGIDLAHLNFKFNDHWIYEIYESETVKYSHEWLKQLKQLTSYSPENLQKLDESYTDYLGEVINHFIHTHQLFNLDAVCSHGHTALHQPQNGLTYQIGNLPKIATLTNQKVVCDFRVGDVALGGQGAPLVPIGDKLLFSNYEFCLNLGGFANISTEIEGKRIAYDICPVNIVLNYYVNKVGLDYDDKGQVAETGRIDTVLLHQLDEFPYYSKPFPKSLGLEWVSKEILPLIDSFQLEIKDVLRTFIEHIAIQIANNLKSQKRCKVLLSGGGAYNDFLISRIKDLTNSTIIIPEPAIVEYKEAMIFGLLGVLKLRNETNCLSSVTGASRNHSSGKVYCP